MGLPDEELETVSLAASTSTLSVLHEQQCTHFPFAFLLFVLQYTIKSVPWNIMLHNAYIMYIGDRKLKKVGLHKATLHSGIHKFQSKLRKLLRNANKKKSSFLQKKPFQVYQTNHIHMDTQLCEVNT